MCHKLGKSAEKCQFYAYFCDVEVKMSEELSRKKTCSKREIIKKFINKHREKLSVLQEASFEKGEKQLVNMMGMEPENQNTFPIPGVFIGILVWAFIILFPLILILDPSHSKEFGFFQLLDYYVPLFATLLIFLVNQRYLVPKLFFRKKYFLYLSLNSILLALVIVLREFSDFLQNRTSHENLMDFFSSYTFLGQNGHFEGHVVASFILADMMVCACCILISIFSRQVLRAFMLREKRRVALQYELDFLKSQLSPHFLFNTLNNITSLISFDPKLAELSMTKLSQLLRVMLYQAGDKNIALKDDLDVLQKYAELEKLRLDDKFQLSFETDIEKPNMMVEPLLVMPLVENAMKHCVDPKGGGFARIYVQQKENELYVKVENSNFPRKAKPNAGGLGLSTLKKRLELLYAGHYSYNARVEGETYIAELNITQK